jgi:hypothetical protein
MYTDVSEGPSAFTFNVEEQAKQLPRKKQMAGILGQRIPPKRRRTPALHSVIS